MNTDPEFIPFRFEKTPEAIVLTDREGRIIWFNPSFTTLCGYELSEVRQKKPGSFLQGAATDPDVVAEVREAIRQGIGCEVQLTNYHKDGHSYGVQIQIEPVKNRSGQITFFAAVERQFTEDETDKFGAETIKLALHAILRDFIDSLQEAQE